MLTMNMKLKTFRKQMMIFNALEYGFGIVAFALFAGNSYLTFKDSQAEKTGLNQYLTTENQLQLPAMTICPKNLYKGTDFPNEMLQNISRYVYGLDDLLGDKFLLQKNNWTITETFSANTGRCFTIKLKKDVTQKSQTWIPFKPDNTYKVYFHEAGNQYWQQLSRLPVPSAEIEFSTHSGEWSNVGFSRVSLEKIHHNRINRKQNPCNANATLESYTQCAFERLTTAENRSCSSIIGYGKSLTDSNICQNFDEFSNVFRSDAALLTDISSSGKCLKPCRTSTYEATLKQFHQNANLLLPQEFVAKDGFLLGIFYDQFTIQHHDEYLVVDDNVLISSIGGFLGLFLGSSMLSISVYFIGLFRKVFNVQA